MIRKVGIITLLATFLLGGYAAATGQYKTIKVFADKVGIMLNGQPAGTMVDVLSHNGTIYVPINSIGDVLGGDVSWDAQNRTVAVDFAKTVGGQVVAASNADIYQYMAIEKNQIMGNLVSLIQKKNYAGMKKEIQRLQTLEIQAKNIGDEKMENLLAQMAFSAEVIRSGLETKKGKNYQTAVNLFLKAEADFTDHLQGLLTNSEAR